jgi:hypothetical protein
MSRIDCRGGQTQIAKILAHARRENDRRKVAALVFVGDAMEETVDRLCAGAGELALRGVPVFMFQEGYDPVCEQAFREIARLTRGAYCRFQPGAAHELGELLRAVRARAALSRWRCRASACRTPARARSNRCSTFNWAAWSGCVRLCLVLAGKLWWAHTKEHWSSVARAHRFFGNTTPAPCAVGS